MATIEQLERESIEITEAESEGVARLIECMRGIAVDLPDGSHLARRLAQYARLLEPYQRPRHAQYACNEMHKLWDDLRREGGAEDKETD